MPVICCRYMYVCPAGPRDQSLEVMKQDQGQLWWASMQWCELPRGLSYVTA